MHQPHDLRSERPAAVVAAAATAQRFKKPSEILSQKPSQNIEEKNLYGFPIGTFVCVY